MHRSFCRMRGAPRLQSLSLPRLTAQLPETWKPPLAIQERHVRTPQSCMDLALGGRCYQRVRPSLAAALPAAVACSSLDTGHTETCSHCSHMCVHDVHGSARNNLASIRDHARICPLMCRRSVELGSSSRQIE